jgi:hypothetical protein
LILSVKLLLLLLLFTLSFWMIRTEWMSLAI